MFAPIETQGGTTHGGSFTSDFISRSEYHNMLLSLPDDENGYVVVGGRIVI